MSRGGGPAWGRIMLMGVACSFAAASARPASKEETAAIEKKACERGSMPGCLNLGVSCVQGAGVPKDLSRAAALFKRACEGGSMVGCANLGHAYVFGDGVAKDEARGFPRTGCRARPA